MLKLLTQYHRRNIRNPDHQRNPNPDFNPQPDGAEASNSYDCATDREDGQLQTASSSSRSVGYNNDRHDDEDGVSEDREVQTASSSGGIAADGDGGSEEVATGAASPSCDKRGNDSILAKKGVEVTSAEKKKKKMEAPPDDDVCPICFGNFVVPCRGPCGHWYCGGCILQYWNYTAAVQPCNCPMCSRKITNLTPEASLYQQQEAGVVDILRNVKKYNRLYVGGTYGLILKICEMPLYLRRMFREMMNPDRPGAHLNKLRIFAMFLGLVYSIGPFDFLRIGRHNVVDFFDYSAIAISFILYGVGLYQRRRRFQHVREQAAIQL